MNYTRYDLGQQRAGTIVIVGLEGTEANVILLDAANLARYDSGLEAHSSDGGHFSRSPVRLRVPHDGMWHVVVDLGGYTGTVRSWIAGVYAAAA